MIVFSESQIACYCSENCIYDNSFIKDYRLLNYLLNTVGVLLQVKEDCHW